MIKLVKLVKLNYARLEQVCEIKRPFNSEKDNDLRSDW